MSKESPINRFKYRFMSKRQNFGRPKVTTSESLSVSGKDCFIQEEQLKGWRANIRSVKLIKKRRFASTPETPVKICARIA